jgi:hypothetical protein
MSTGNSFIDWCRVPPEPPKNRHKKLLASSLILTILGVSIVAGLSPLCGVSLMFGQTSAVALPSGFLSVANLAQGQYYIKNATLQGENESNCMPFSDFEAMKNFVQKENCSVLRFGGGVAYSDDECGYIKTAVCNFGDQNLTVTSIEIYQGDALFAVLNGSFTVKACSRGVVDFQLFNLTCLGKAQVQQVLCYGENNVVKCDWAKVQYRCVMRTVEGVVATFDRFTFPVSVPVPDC